MQKLFNELAKADFFKHCGANEFSEGAAHFLAELNAIHPFREGNGRTQLAFVSLLAHRASWPFDLDRLNPTTFLSAMIDSFAGREMALSSQLQSLIRR